MLSNLDPICGVFQKWLDTFKIQGGSLSLGVSLVASVQESESHHT